MMETSAARKRLIGGCGSTSDMKRGESPQSIHAVSVGALGVLRCKGYLNR